MKLGWILVPFLTFIFSTRATTLECRAFYNTKLKSTLSRSAIVRELVETLFIGVPISVRPFSANQNKNSLFLVKLQNPETGQIITALFKPRSYGDGDGWNRVTMEYASYEVSKLLGLEIIPPVAYRYHLTLNGRYFAEGSMQYFVDGAKMLKEIKQDQWNTDADYFISDARVLDILLQNPDRHVGNFIFGPSWIDGTPRPFLIDQAANMRKGTNMRLSTKGPFNDKIISKFNPKTIAKLRQLNEKNLSVAFPFISKSEIKRILHHRDGILSFVNSQ